MIEPWGIPPNRGRFTIAVQAVTEEPEIVRTVLQGLIVIRCECRFDRGHFEYVAIGAPFRAVAPGEAVPDYDIIFSENDHVAKYFAGFRERRPANEIAAHPARLEASDDPAPDAA